ncbi:MAG: hypothetical protein A2Z03_10240, partial [Chloroflexi bacterium RBG_16_56_8]
LVILLAEAVFPAQAAPGDTTRVSVGPSGAQSNGSASAPAISSDGRFVAFHSMASNLVSGDTLGNTDIFVHDRQTGVTERVSLDSSGAQANGNSYLPSISSDGNLVAFESYASNLVSGDTNNKADIFIRDRQLGTTALVSVGLAGAPANGDSSIAGTTGNGRYVTFTSTASNLVNGDTNGVQDIFVRDLQLGTTSLVSVVTGGALSDDNSGGSSLSSDGRFVAFGSIAKNLTANDAKGDIEDVFVHDRQTDETTCVSLAPDGTAADGSSIGASISSDGRYVAFSSAASNLVSGDANGWADIFVHDRQTGLTSRVSVNSSGAETDNDSDSAVISGNGRFVIFASYASNLVPGDTNGTNDIFVYDRATSTIERVSVDSGGSEANGESGTPAISSDGSLAAFNSLANNLVAGDTNNEWDIFAHENVFEADTTAPSVLSVTRADGSPTAAQYVNYTVTFSEAVTGVDDGDFKVTRVGGAIQGYMVPEDGVTGDGATWTVTVYTGYHNGTLRLDVKDNDSIVDFAGNPLGGTGTSEDYFTTGELYWINRSITSMAFRSNGTNDGWVLESGETTDVGGSMNTSATSMWVGDNIDDKQFRAILHFPTYDLPDDAAILSVVLKVKKISVTFSDPFTTHGNLLVDIRRGTFGTAALQLTDFQAAASGNTVGVFQGTSVGSWYSAVLERTAIPYINLTGVTQFRLRFELDDNDDSIANTLKFFSGNTDSGNDRPLLVVEYLP